MPEGDTLAWIIRAGLGVGLAVLVSPFLSPSFLAGAVRRVLARDTLDARHLGRARPAPGHEQPVEPTLNPLLALWLGGLAALGVWFYFESDNPAVQLLAAIGGAIGALFALLAFVRKPKHEFGIGPTDEAEDEFPRPLKLAGLIVGLGFALLGVFRLN